MTLSTIMMPPGRKAFEREPRVLGVGLFVGVDEGDVVGAGQRGQHVDAGAAVDGDAVIESGPRTVALPASMMTP